MEGVATDDLLLATLSLESESAGTVALSTVVDTIGGSGQRLSQQVEVAVAVERLVERGLVRREPTADTELFSLTDEGRASATAVVDRLADQQIELVDDDDHRELPLGEAADELGRSPVSIAAECSEDGIYYREQQVEATGLVGRSDQQVQFEAVLDRVERTGDGETVRLVGPGGSGKTTFVDAMVESMPDRVEVCQTSSAPAETEPYQPIQNLLDQFGNEDALSTPEFDVDDAESYEAQQTGLFTDITERLTPESGSRVLVFDDINHADAGTWAYLESLCQQLADRPLVVVLVHRPGTLPEDAPIHPSRDTAETSLELTGLDHDGTRRLIEQVLGYRGVPEAFVTAVHDRTGGAPLFVETTVETLRETNQVDPQLQVYPTDPDEFELPAEVTATIQQQATFLEADVREVLEWVAVASGFIPVSLVQRAADHEPERVATILETVTQMGLLEQETRDGKTHVTFRNEVFGEALAERLSGADREQCHETIAHLLEGQSNEHAPGDDERTADRATTIAFHHEQSGDRESGIEWYERAADRATDSYAHEAAIEHYYRVIDLARAVDDTERLLSANERLAETYLVTGEYDEAEKHVQFVRERIGDDVERRQRAARLQTRIASARGEFDAAVETASEALDWDTGPTLERCRLLGVLARAQQGKSSYEQARKTAQRQRELAASLDESSLEGDALYRLGVVARRQDAYDDAHEYTRRSLERRRQIGDRKGEGRALGSLGIIARLRGELDRAREYHESALERCRETGDRYAEAVTLHSLGKLSADQGLYDQARTYFEQCLEISRDVGDRQGEAWSLDGIGDVAMKRGAYDRAREYLTQSIEIMRALGDRTGETYSQEALGRVRIKQGQYDTARESLERSLELAREIGDRRGEAVSMDTLGDIERIRGAYQRASEYYEESLEIIRETDDTLTVARTLSDLGDLARQRGAHDQAREYYEEALTIAESDHPPVEAVALRGLCAVIQALGDDERASEYFERALTLSEEAGERSEVAQTQYEGGRLALSRGSIETARERATRAHDTFETLGTPLWLGRAQRLLGSIEREDGQTATAREHLTAAVERFEELGAVADTLRTVEMLVDLCQENGDEAAEKWSQHALEVLAEAPEATATVHGEWVDSRASAREET